MKILLITPNFFEYPKMICDQLKSMGHQVDWFDDRPSTNSVIKAAIRINKNSVNFLIKSYFKKLLSEIEDKQYDKFILISGQSLSFSTAMIESLKEKLPNTEFILYQWDSEKNFSYIKLLQKYFDRCYSFDRYDVSMNNNMTFLPLFYGRNYEEIGSKKNTIFKYDVMFVGTAHPKKYKFVSEVSNKLSKTLKKQFIYFFFPSRLVYFYRKLRNPELKDSRYSEFHFKPMSNIGIDNIMSESKCILDSAQDGQTGLPIRIIEALGAKKKGDHHK